MDDIPNQTQADYSAPAPNTEERNAAEIQKSLSNELVIEEAVVVPVDLIKNDDPEKSKSSNSQLMIIFLVVIIFAATALTIGIAVGNRSTSSSPVLAPPKSSSPVKNLRGDKIKIEMILD